MNRWTILFFPDCRGAPKMPELAHGRPRRVSDSGLDLLPGCRCRVGKVQTVNVARPQKTSERTPSEIGACFSRPSSPASRSSLARVAAVGGTRGNRR